MRTLFAVLGIVGLVAVLSGASNAVKPPLRSSVSDVTFVERELVPTEDADQTVEILETESVEMIRSETVMQEDANTKAALFETLDYLDIADKTNVAEFVSRIPLSKDVVVELRENNTASIAWDEDNEIVVNGIYETEKGLESDVQILQKVRLLSDVVVFSMDVVVEVIQRDNDIILTPSSEELELPQIVLNIASSDTGYANSVNNEGDITGTPMIDVGAAIQDIMIDPTQIQATKVCRCVGGGGSCSHKMCTENVSCKNSLGDCTWVDRPSSACGHVDVMVITFTMFQMCLWMAARRCR